MIADTLIFSCYLEYILLFSDDNVTKNTNNFKLTKVQSEGDA